MPAPQENLLQHFSLDTPIDGEIPSYHQYTLVSTQRLRPSLREAALRTGSVHRCTEIERLVPSEVEVSRDSTTACRWHSLSKSCVPNPQCLKNTS
ncbi:MULTISPECIES: hypothetical protein [unclassified Nostoc]|uniref:hypothetical protein n=1 Tax=unclassified Nostoc TaxID=2593658 RepID=UPI0025AB49DA|nr:MULTISPECIES: hypothetical protein [unclassified Nostoc]MDM9585448.1 hypothetical protein [Nostoc sp. GT001]MDZ7945807.1 hypothetical protein [Nostoc sp. EfeVER01]MDZ7995574.1 hypothetical protein [Nostoc sp. EspVER01]